MLEFSRKYVILLLVQTCSCTFLRQGKTRTAGEAMVGDCAQTDFVEQLSILKLIIY